jgi:hypothetical protein
MLNELQQRLWRRAYFLGRCQQRDARFERLMTGGDPARRLAIMIIRRLAIITRLDLGSCDGCHGYR